MLLRSVRRMSCIVAPFEAHLSLQRVFLICNSVQEAAAVKIKIHKSKDNKTSIFLCSKKLV